MAQWQRTLDIVEAWQTEDPKAVATAIAKGLAEMLPFSLQDIEEQRQQLLAVFSDIAKEDNVSVQELDYRLDELYDWGDIALDGNMIFGRKVCWVKKF